MKKYVNLIRFTKNWPNYFYAKYLDKKQEPIHFVGKNNVKLEVPREIILIFKEIYMDDLYILSFLKEHLPKDPKIVDIGANVGFFATFMADHFPQSSIYAFEPLITNFNQLKKNCELNPDRNMVAKNQAVSGKPGSITLYYNPEKTLTPLASTSASFDNKNVKKTEVEAVTLEQIMDEYNLDRIDLLKLDCEGAEYDILYNAPTHLFDKIGMMTMEVHNGDVPRENLEDLKKFLTDLGYQIRTRGDDFVWAWRS